MACGGCHGSWSDGKRKTAKLTVGLPAAIAAVYLTRGLGYKLLTPYAQYLPTVGRIGYAITKFLEDKYGDGRPAYSTLVEEGVKEEYERQKDINCPKKKAPELKSYPKR